MQVARSSHVTAEARFRLSPGQITQVRPAPAACPHISSVHFHVHIHSHVHIHIHVHMLSTSSMSTWYHTSSTCPWDLRCTPPSMFHLCVSSTSCILDGPHPRCLHAIHKFMTSLRPLATMLHIYHHQPKTTYLLPIEERTLEPDAHSFERDIYIYIFIYFVCCVFVVFVFTDRSI